MEYRKDDLTGRRFGMLVVIKKRYQPRNGTFRWICKCDCGKVVEYPSSRLLDGNSKSCGCDSQNKKVFESSKTKAKKESLLESWVKRMLLENGNSFIDDALVNRYGIEGTECLIKMKWGISVTIKREVYGDWIAWVKKNENI